LPDDDNPLEAIADECDMLDDIISWLVGWRHYQRSILRGALEATGHKSSTTLVRGRKIGLRTRQVMVCECHKVVPYACPIASDGTPIAVTMIDDGETLYISKG
jgi:hypothetical protein